MQPISGTEGAMRVNRELAALTPLWPAGHLPLKGGDRQFRCGLQICHVGDWRKQPRQRISPLDGEMAGRPVGGTFAPQFGRFQARHP